MAEQIMWAVTYQGVEISGTRMPTSIRAKRIFGDKFPTYSSRWKLAKLHGYRCIRVKVTEVDGA